jgi:creatinine amidohydrolase
MPVFTEQLSQEVRLERMRPAQIRAAQHERPAIYVPFGALEWHGHHNPVGLDGLKAHEQLVGLASRCGGVVYPPIHFGSGGGHGSYDHSFMVSPEPMIGLVRELLAGFEGDGYRAVILLSGHYPNRGRYLDAAVEHHRAAGGAMSVLPIVEKEAAGVGGDHAAKYETSAMLHLDPTTVDMAALGPANPKERAAEGSWVQPEHRDHPCYGLIGVDPRGTASAEVGREHTEALLSHLADWLNTHVPAKNPR